MAFPLNSYSEGRVTCIEVPARLTRDNSPDLIALLRELVEKGQVKIVVNMLQTRRIDSSGIGALVSQIATLRARQGDIRLANVHDFVREVLSITHLDQVIKIFPSLEEAVQSYGEAG